MIKILKLGTIVSLTSLPLLSFVSCSSFNSEVEFLLNSLVDSPAKETYSNTIVAEQKAREYSNSIRSGDQNIASNIVNASIFTNYPLAQQIGQELVMQIQPLVAEQEGTTIILTVRIEYSFNVSNSVKHYSKDKKLVVQFYVPS